jgi:hypothetical protein
MLTIQKEGDTWTEDIESDTESRKKLLSGWKWKKKCWRNWVESNPEWAAEWTAPERWLPGEQEWLEGRDSAQEAKRRGRLQALELLRRRKEEDPERWERHQRLSIKLDQDKERRKAEKEAEKERIRASGENWWKEYHANQLEELKKKNREEMESQDLLSRSEGHLLEHLDGVPTSSYLPFECTGNRTLESAWGVAVLSFSVFVHGFSVNSLRSFTLSVSVASTVDRDSWSTSCISSCRSFFFFFSSDLFMDNDVIVFLV